MKIRISSTLIVITMICTINYNSNSQGLINKSAGEWRTKIETVNNKVEQLYLAEDVNSLTDMYAEQLTYYPEYKAAIYDIRSLGSFFKDWFKAGNVNAYKKKIHTVEAIADHILETGTFSLRFSSIHQPQGEYKGQYMILWKADNAGELSIVSEIFGSNTYIEPELVPYADVQVQEKNFIAKHTVSQQIQDEVVNFDKVLLKAVAEGDGETRAKGFTNDAILMSNFDTLRVGMENIRPRLLNTYKPGSSYIVKHTYSRIYDLGDYVFVNGHYKGGDVINGGKFEGKMSNLMKRDENGKLLMHRQKGNRDKK